jgi:hypothetical protein
MTPEPWLKRGAWLVLVNAAVWLGVTAVTEPANLITTLVLMTGVMAILLLAP